MSLNVNCPLTSMRVPVSLHTTTATVLLMKTYRCFSSAVKWTKVDRTTASRILPLRERSSFRLCPVLTAAVVRLVVSARVPPSMSTWRPRSSTAPVTSSPSLVPPFRHLPASMYSLLGWTISLCTASVCRTVLFTSSLFLLPRNSARVVRKANDRDAGRGSFATQCAPHVSATPSTRITISERSTVNFLLNVSKRR